MTEEESLTRLKLVSLKIVGILESAPVFGEDETVQQLMELRKLIEGCAMGWEGRFALLAAAYHTAIRAVEKFHAGDEYATLFDALNSISLAIRTDNSAGGG